MSELPRDFDWRAFTPEDSPRTPMEVLADPLHQRLASPTVTEGGAAHDFTLPLYDFSDGRQATVGRSFNLLEAARAKPVALIFGSYT